MPGALRTLFICAWVSGAGRFAGRGRQRSIGGLGKRLEHDLLRRGLVVEELHGRAKQVLTVEEQELTRRELFLAGATRRAAWLEPRPQTTNQGEQLRQGT